MAASASRNRIAFRAVNRCGARGYDPDLQRHHLLPRQLLFRRCFEPMFDTVGRESVGFDDFRRNGLLLPAREEATIRLGMPLHRGPHRHYNELVIERVGEIEKTWSQRRARAAHAASAEVLMRLDLLQRALRRRLLNPMGRFFTLNLRDPLGKHVDFSALDAMVDALWSDTNQER